MRGHRVEFRLGKQAQSLGHRYRVSLSNGMKTLAYNIGPTDNQYTRGHWNMLLGETYVSVAPSFEETEVFLHIYRQIPNDDFDFENPASYDHGSWAWNLPVFEGRCMNPPFPFGRPFIDEWAGGKTIREWTFSQDETWHKEYDLKEYSWDESLPKIDYGPYKWSIHRAYDSDNFKEWVITLGE